MRLAVILYIFAACCITAAVTHHLTRTNLAERFDRRTQTLVQKLDPKKDSEKIAGIYLATRAQHIAHGMPCELAYLLTIPGATTLYGALFIHHSIRTKKDYSEKRLWIGMVFIFVITLFFVGLIIPC